MMLRRVKTQMIVDQRSDQEVIEQVSSLQPPAKKKQDQKRSSFYGFCQQEMELERQTC